jgi:hypothetical protein
MKEQRVFVAIVLMRMVPERGPKATSTGKWKKPKGSQIVCYLDQRLGSKNDHLTRAKIVICSPIPELPELNLHFPCYGIWGIFFLV